MKTKLPVPSPGRELYVSPLFKGRRAYVEQTCDEWFILSAKHGLIDPDEVVDPYDQTLKEASILERKRWTGQVLGALSERLGTLADTVFEVHAGKEYLDFGLVDGLLKGGARVDRPTEGLSFGQQVAFYQSHEPVSSSKHERENHQQPQHLRTPRHQPGGKYAALVDALRVEDAVDLSFDEIDGMVGGLPASARNHRAWWANDKSHVQAREWLAAGMKVVAVDLASGRVRFRSVR